MSRDELSARLLATFVTELEDQVGAFNEGLLALESDPGDEEALRLLFRVAHTVKGAARVTAVPAVEELCDTLESFFAAVREGRRKVGAAHFPHLYAAADLLAEAGRQLRESGSVHREAIEELIHRLRRTVAEPDARDAEIQEAPRLATAPEGGPLIRVERSTESPPASGPDRAGAVQLAGDWVRVESRRLDGLLAATSELVLASGRLAARRDEWQAVAGRLAEAASETAATDGTLAEAARRVAQLAQRQVVEVRELERVTSGVGAAVHRLRLRPIGEMWEALPRALRDAASLSGKRVRLELQGAELQADRLVIDTLREPLLHLIRNAVDHGIESPDARRAAGKPEEGRVRLSATLDGDRLVIRVEDDGRGLDTAAIRERLAALGQPAPDSDEELARRLLEGGLSTRREATALSGRGVGIDLVRSALEEIGGGLELSWEAGRGTAFVLEAPPSPTSIRALLVNVSSQIFALPNSHVDRLLHVQPDRVVEADGRPVLTGHGEPIPLLSLARVLGPPLQARPMGGSAPAVLIQAGGRRAALLVDELVAEEEILVRPLAHQGSAVPHVHGGTILPTGRVALVLSAASLMTVARDGGAAVELRRPEPDEPKHVLVVDDSITTRTLEQSILEAAGYRVETAVDGLDGWQRLQERSFDAVVADVEMPRMDGLTLCERIRASSRLAELPVVLVTAKESEADRARGLEVGANAYLEKSSFDHADLLDSLEQLIG